METLLLGRDVLIMAVLRNGNIASWSGCVDNGSVEKWKHYLFIGVC